MNSDEKMAKRQDIFWDILEGKISEEDAIAGYMSTGENYDDAKNEFIRDKLYGDILSDAISEKEAIAGYMSTGEDYEEAEKSYLNVVSDMQKAKYGLL